MTKNIIDALDIPKREKRNLKTGIVLLQSMRIWNAEIYRNIDRPSYKLDVLRTYISRALFEAFSVMVFIGGLVVVMLSLAQDLIFPNDTYWLQRAGAVLVATSLIAEYAAFRVDDIDSPALNGWEHAWVDRVRRLVQPTGFVAAAVGTLIWAYGDLPFR